MAKPADGSSSKLHVNFSKLHGAQNDFIAIDNRRDEIRMTNEQRRLMCTRHLGVGSDGLMEIHASDTADFRIVHFNADGNQASLCGNGLRCGLIFCRKIGISMRKVKDEDDHDDDDEEEEEGHKSNGVKVSENGVNSSPPPPPSSSERGSSIKTIEADIKRYGFPKSYYVFEAFDGLHFGALSETGDECFILFRPVDMADVKRYDDGDLFLDTGSPHHVRFVASVDDVDAEAVGRPIRYGVYGDEGSNVNFVSEKRSQDFDTTGVVILRAKTYERGNECETRACGTGAVAIAIADVIRRRFAVESRNGVSTQDEQREGEGKGSREEGCRGGGGGEGGERWFSRYIEMPGGMLRVYFRLNGGRADSVWLQGPALCVMDGCYPLG